MRDTRRNFMYQGERNFGANPSYWRGDVSNTPNQDSFRKRVKNSAIYFGRVFEMGSKGFTYHINEQVTIFAIGGIF